MMVALALAGCSGTTVGLGAAAAGIWETRPDEKPPADTAHQIANHENWCYETLGDPACYSNPQAVDPNRLINVDPENRYPLTARDYKEDVQQAQ